MDEEICLIYKREIEGMERTIKRLKEEQEQLSDPSSKNVKGNQDEIDFDATAYVSKEVEIGVKIRDLENKLGVTRKKYEYVYGCEE